MTTDGKVHTGSANEGLQSSVNRSGSTGTITYIVTMGCQAADIKREDIEIRRKFNQLTRQWEQERPRGLDVNQMINNPIYRQVIDLGPGVIPLLLSELERKPAYWFSALQFLARDNPVPEQNYGKVREMAKAWLAWGKQQGYQW